jgi:hypothetical protein
MEFAVSAEMSDRLKAVIEAVAEEDWKPLRKVSDQGWVVGRKEWAEIEYVPTIRSSSKDMGSAERRRWGAQPTNRPGVQPCFSPRKKVKTIIGKTY